MITKLQNLILLTCKIKCWLNICLIQRTTYSVSGSVNIEGSDEQNSLPASNPIKFGNFWPSTFSTVGSTTLKQ